METDDLSEQQDPFSLFGAWMQDATAKEINDPNGMALATVDSDGQPNVRMVLLKGLDGPEVARRGFVFYTNYQSAKGMELQDNPKAALLFHWKSLRRQVRVRGAVEQVSEAEANEYFASRPRASRIGAWASDQSRRLEGRWALEQRVASYTAKFGFGEVPRPPHWSGFRVLPEELEFWADRPFRLHERLVFRRATSGHAWDTFKLFP